MAENKEEKLGSTSNRVDWTLWVERVECKLHEIGGITNALWEWEDGENAIDDLDLDDEAVRESLVAHAYGRETARLSTAAIVRFCKKEYLKARLNEDRKDLYYALMKMTTAYAWQEVRRLGIGHVHKARVTLERIYQKKVEIEKKKKEKLVEQGISREDGRKFQDHEDLQRHVQGFEKLVDDLKSYVSKGELDTYLHAQPANMSKYFARGLPPSYTDILNNISVMKELVSTTGGQTAHEIDTGIDTYPEWPQFKGLLLRMYNRKLARDDDLRANGNAKRVPMHMTHTEKGEIRERINPGGEVSEGCWDCGGDHLRNSVEWERDCQYKGSFAFAPARNGGKGGDSKPCWLHAKGYCHHGDRCKFSHGSNFDGSYRAPYGTRKGKGKGKGRGRGKGKGKSKGGKRVFKTEKAFQQAAKQYTKKKERGTKAFMAMVEELSDLHSDSKPVAVAASSAGSGDAGDAKRKIMQILQKAKKQRAFAVRVPMLASHVNDQSWVGIDSCSGVSATTESSDIIMLDTSPAAVQGYEIEGVGGAISYPIGVGVGIFPHQCLTTGRVIVVFDVRTVLLKKNRASDSTVRILGSNKLKKSGLCLQQGVGPVGTKDILKCKYTQREISLCEVHELVAMRTIRKRASNYKNNRGLLRAIALCREDKGPPYAVLWSSQVTSQGARSVFC